MATVNFMLTSPIAVDGDMNVTETKMVMRVNELFQELRQISGVQVAMSDIGYADGTDYCATVSVKNQWYASAVQLRRVAEQFDSQYRGREYADVGDDLPKFISWRRYMLGSCRKCMRLSLI